jgi:hypothetical protein
MVGAESICFIVLPLAIKDVSINMVKDSTTMSFVILPLTFIFGTIWPGLHSVSMAESTF